MNKFVYTLLGIVFLSSLIVEKLQADNIEKQIPIVGKSFSVEEIKPMTPLLAINKYSNQYGANAGLIRSMGTCESNLKPNAKGDIKNGVYLAKGIMQYHSETWARHTKIMGEKLNINSYEDQVKLVTWISVNKPDLLREWTSYRAIKNGGTYSFYSSLLKKKFIVKCKLLA